MTCIEADDPPTILRQGSRAEGADVAFAAL